MDKLNTTHDVIEAVKTRAEIAPYAKVVGQWVWLEFPGKPAEEIRSFIKAIGFRWNPKRNAWQHACGVYRRFNKRGDPRLQYGEESIA